MVFEVLFFSLIGFPFSVDHYVIHVDCEGSAHDLFVEYRVHHGLESSGGVGESEEHYYGFEESMVGYKCHLMLVFRYDSDRVIPPLYVDCGD
jgi:hypothetical protein